ncbi:MAG: prepilin-type N-terminal cleavage/methylation protein [Herminiimonas sp.]|nr:prepilin-type N-terminal cleavage/methylation protein [Herminiimonas sp.]MDB5852075.1 prepilin-type N-terminal cleavage/methylation protein [Herminiimonas sp.]
MNLIMDTRAKLESVHTTGIRPGATSGFTLVELMVTVSISAILLAIGVPSFNSFIVSQRVSAAASDVSTMLTFARSEAIKRNGNVIVTQKSGGWQNGWTTQSSGNTVGQQEAFSNLAIANSTSALTYNNTGRIAGSGTVTFQITGGTNIRCVTVDLSGMPKSKNGSCP